MDVKAPTSNLIQQRDSLIHEVDRKGKQWIEKFAQAVISLGGKTSIPEYLYEGYGYDIKVNYQFVTGCVHIYCKSSHDDNSSFVVNYISEDDFFSESEDDFFSESEDRIFSFAKGWYETHSKAYAEEKLRAKFKQLYKYPPEELIEFANLLKACNDNKIVCRYEYIKEKMLGE